MWKDDDDTYDLSMEKKDKSREKRKVDALYSEVSEGVRVRQSVCEAERVGKGEKKRKINRRGNEIKLCPDRLVSYVFAA